MWWITDVLLVHFLNEHIDTAYEKWIAGTYTIALTCKTTVLRNGNMGARYSFIFKNITDVSISCIWLVLYGTLSPTKYFVSFMFNFLLLDRKVERFSNMLMGKK